MTKTLLRRFFSCLSGVNEIPDLVARGHAELLLNTPYRTAIRGRVDNNKFVGVLPRDEKNVRKTYFFFTEGPIPDYFIKVSPNDLLALDKPGPGERSERIKGVVHQLDPEAVAVANPAQKNRRDHMA